MNQDVLERFFGIIRLAGGQNEHPTMPTFLQLYNMLSVYSLLKPPKFGNCQTELGQEAPCLTLAELTSAFKDESPGKSKLQELRKRLDGYVSEEPEWEAIYDHSYALDKVVDCIVYYVTRFVCRKLLNSTTCETCKLGLARPVAHSQIPEAALVNYAACYYELRVKNSSIETVIHRECWRHFHNLTAQEIYVYTSECQHLVRPRM
ncbi:hypothetical protein HPB51_025206 [Rhipicephalus microplus]|uniref:Transposable element P transposase-like RNase H C-terminal domain-containing protein n=1 Tax=Rhipicephalus microplus TaxID=6941 RepID=A0A9J6EEC3_RHIMP|nr:hypothetical protein HPB51_025206 [Rhipicephalus microplus]